MAVKFWLSRKVMGILYKSDILIIVVVLCVFSISFNFMLALIAKKPPLMTEIDLSPERQAQLIKEFLEDEDEIREPESHYKNAQKLKSPLRSGQLHDFIQNPKRNFQNSELQVDKKSKRIKTKKWKDSGNRVQYANYDSYFQDGKNSFLHHEIEKIDTNAPVGGKLGGGIRYCNLYNFEKEKPPDEIRNCTTLGILWVQPAIPICLYPDEEDEHVSYQIRHAGVWEPHIMELMQNILHKDQSYGFIDIGAHIGMYTLTAAGMGHRVVAVEPFIGNIRRIHKAALLGKVQSKISVVKNAVSDERTVTQVLGESNNKGSMRVSESVDLEDCKTMKNLCTEERNISTIYMDDILEVVNFTKAIIKIDIEGHEYRAFIHSTELFQRVYISHILMEWLKLKQYFGSRATESVQKDLTFDLILLLNDRGYAAFSTVTGEKLNRLQWYAWPDDVIWKHYDVID